MKKLKVIKKIVEENENIKINEYAFANYNFVEISNIKQKNGIKYFTCFEKDEIENSTKKISAIYIFSFDESENKVFMKRNLYANTIEEFVNDMADGRIGNAVDNIAFDF